MSYVSKNYQQSSITGPPYKHNHKSNDDKCDSCGQEFENRETLIEHIVHNHTGGRI